MKNEDVISMFVDTIIMKAGMATLRSMKTKEPRSLINIPLELRLSVVAEVTEGIEALISDQLEEKERQKKLTEGLGIFLSDAIDQGLISTCRRMVDQKEL